MDVTRMGREIEEVETRVWEVSLAEWRKRKRRNGKDMKKSKGKGNVEK